MWWKKWARRSSGDSRVTRPPYLGGGATLISAGPLPASDQTTEPAPTASSLMIYGTRSWEMRHR
eukprot:1395445-Lingulodinium_polyedra.AAC.1